jgi:hypothetical protein
MEGGEGLPPLAAGRGANTIKLIKLKVTPNLRTLTNKYGKRFVIFIIDINELSDIKLKVKPNLRTYLKHEHYN